MTAGLSNHCQVTSGLIFSDPSQLSTIRQPGLTQHSYRLVPWRLKELTARGYSLSTYNRAAMKEANVYPYDNFAALDVMTIVPNLCFPRIRLVK